MPVQAQLVYLAPTPRNGLRPGKRYP
jgi:hypothetical protein